MPISAARPSPPSRSGRQRNRPSPMRLGPKPLRHNRYRPSSPHATSWNTDARFSARLIRSIGESLRLSATFWPERPSRTASIRLTSAV